MLVLGAIIDQQEEPRGRQALDQTVQQCLRLGIDPMQILKDQYERLDLAFTQQHALQGVERALAALRRVKRQKGAVVREGIQQPQQRWNRHLEGRVERQHLPGHLGAGRARVVAVLQVAVPPEEVEHREVGRGLAVGD